MSICFLVGDINSDILEKFAIGEKSINSSTLNGCFQGIKEPTSVTPSSESSLDHIIHDDCLTILCLVSSKLILQIIIERMSEWI